MPDSGDQTTRTGDGERVPAPTAGWQSWLGLDEVVFGALLLLSLGGIAIADFSAGSGLLYWLYLVPAFFGASIFASWSRSRAAGQSAQGILTRQALHWLPLLLAFYAVYFLERTGRLNRADAGLVALLALSLTTFLAGVHFDWRLAVLGALLGVAAACAALVEEFFWILLIPALLVGAGMLLWRRRAS